MAIRSDTSTPSSTPSSQAASTTNAAPTDTGREYRGAGIMWSAVALLVAIAAFLVVVVQNTHDVVFEFLWFDTTISLSLALAITFGTALVLGEVIGFVWRRRRRTRRRERDELKRLRHGG